MTLGGHLRHAGSEPRVTDPSHLYLWVPNALLTEGLRVMEAWGFAHKTNIASGKKY